MARNRLNAWPSVADLFSALTVVAFAALIVIAVGAVVLTQKEQEERQGAKELAGIFRSLYQQQNGQSVQVGPCEDRQSDQCIEIDFRFKRNVGTLEEVGEDQVKQACQIYKTAVDKLVMSLRQQHISFSSDYVVLIIEGNTDSTIPEKITDPRERYLFNWKLSSERAASVVYEFHRCGVASENGYHISSVGLAATRLLCKDTKPDEKCHEQNRRTTMRIRVQRDEQIGTPSS